MVDEGMRHMICELEDTSKAETLFSTGSVWRKWLPVCPKDMNSER